MALSIAKLVKFAIFKEYTQGLPNLKTRHLTDWNIYMIKAYQWT